MVDAHPKSKRNNHMFYGVCTSQVKKEYNNIHRLYYMVLIFSMVVAHPMSGRSTTICKLLNSRTGQWVDPSQYNLEGIEEYDCTM
jgi:hypothetical protein